MEQILIKARQIAVEAALAAGVVHRNKFDTGFTTDEKGEFGDVVTEADYLAEAEILPRIAGAFPDHLIRSEETGWSGVDSEWLWLVDPLDGTNNFVIGLPVFGVSITLLYRNNPVLGVIYDSMLDRCYVAEKGKGANCNGKPLHINDKRDLRKMTVGWIQGHIVQKNERAMQLKAAVDASFKRVLRLWAPALLWSMLARGDLEGIVLYNSEGDDLYAGILMAREAGAIVVDYEGKPFEGMNSEPYIIACHPANRESFLRIVGDGLQAKDGWSNG